MTVLYIDVVKEQVTTSSVKIYTAPSTGDFESSHIVYANCANEGAVDTELTINIVQSGGSAGVTNRYFPPKVIFAGDTDPLAPIVGRAIKTGDFISCTANLVDNLNLSLTIKEIYSDA